MQQQKIYMQAWLDAHGRAKVVNTDKWYLDFANQLLPLVAESYIYGGKDDGRRPEASGSDVCPIFGRLCSRWRKLASVYPLASGKLRTLPAFLHVVRTNICRTKSTVKMLFPLWAINSPVGNDLTEWRTRWMQICWSLQMYYTNRLDADVRIGSYQ